MVNKKAQHRRARGTIRGLRAEIARLKTRLLTEQMLRDRMVRDIEENAWTVGLRSSGETFLYQLNVHRFDAAERSFAWIGLELHKLRWDGRRFQRPDNAKSLCINVEWSRPGAYNEGEWVRQQLLDAGHQLGSAMVADRMDMTAP
jgi:hypothetical protein